VVTYRGDPGFSATSLAAEGMPHGMRQGDRSYVATFWDPTPGLPATNSRAGDSRAGDSRAGSASMRWMTRAAAWG
jgi:hypothetical protein